MPKITKEIEFWKCCKCNHEWEQRKKNKPFVCPNCNSAKWDTQENSPLNEEVDSRSPINGALTSKNDSEREASNH